MENTLTLKVPKSSIKHFFTSVVLLEIFLGGGGRLLDIGTLSIRMYLFCVCLFVGTIFFIIARPFNKQFLLLLTISTISLVFSTLVGLLNHAPLVLVLNDLKPLLSIYYLLFFYYVIVTLEDVNLVSRLIIFSSIFLALAYLVTVGMLASGVLPFAKFYNMVGSTEEFFFRDQTLFFYKAFIYMCVGLFFVITTPSIRFRKTCITILLLAILLTLTRGFFLTVGLTYLFYVVFIQKKGVKFLVSVGLIAVAFFIGREYYLQQRSSKTLNTSDSARIIQLQEVAAAVTPVSFFIGHGFGIGVPSRVDNMEIAYAEVFHKQGLIGLLYWLFIFLLALWYYARAVDTGFKQQAAPFLLAVVAIFVQSFTNPYINNPIGLTMVLVSIISLNVLSKTPSSFITGG